MDRSLHTKTLRLGVCYYPEHWPERLWAEDMRRMAAHGISLIRIAEFAWNLIEPQEGVFNFDFFDRVLDCAQAAGMGVVMGTPTATPPAWLTRKYPEVLNAQVDGTRFEHGMRRHYNYNAPIYRDLSARIVEKMAQRWCPHPAVEGWQIDNELNCEIAVFYSEADHTAFRAWLKDRHGTLDALNDAWGTVFWNQTYTDWEEVHLTRPNVSGSNNPHALLDEKRFFSDSARSFCKLQSDILRRYAPAGQYITTNGVFSHLDSHAMTQESLDFICYDSYPQFGNALGAVDNGLFDRKWSGNLAQVRSISPNFMVMEQQSGAGGWVTRMAAPMPKPGQMRLWTYQSVAHGADIISYFRWRTAAFGTEIYWHGLLGYDNRDNRRLAELDRIRDEFDRVGRRLAGSRYVARCAILRDYDNEFDAEEDGWLRPLVKQSEMAWLSAFQHAHIPYDYVYWSGDGLSADLSQYDFVVYPHPAILPEDRAAQLRAYVEQGGQLLFGARTGYKDLCGRCPMQPMPGYAADLVGATVDDFTLIGPFDEPVAISLSGQVVEAPQFHDLLSVTTGQAIGSFAGGWYDGRTAAVRNDLGQGAAYYHGAAFTEASAQAYLAYLGIQGPLEGNLDLPRDVEVAIREKPGARTVLLLNYSVQPQEIPCNTEWTNLLTGEPVSGALLLPGYGVALLG